MTSPEFDLFYQQLLSRTIPANQSITEIRAAFEKLFADSAPDIHFEQVKLHTLPACWVSAPHVNKNRVILFFHGGGFTIGSTHSHRDFLGRLSRACNSPILGIDYRLAPEHPFPAALDDALAAYQWLLLHHPVPPSRLVLAGISAGAGLILSLCLHLQMKNIPLPAACLSLCPWVDLAMTSPSIQTNEGKDVLTIDRSQSSAKMYYGNNDPKNPLISPLYGNLQGLPPLFIQTGTRDLLFDEAVAFAAKAKQAGVQVTLEKWQDMVHSWTLFSSRFPEGQEAIDQIGKFLNHL